GCPTLVSPFCGETGWVSRRADGVHRLRSEHVPPHAGGDEDRRPINRLKNFAESTSNATLALGTNLSRNTCDVRVPARVGAEPRIDIFMAAVCFSASGLRRRSPALGL